MIFVLDGCGSDLRKIRKSFNDCSIPPPAKPSSTFVILSDSPSSTRSTLFPPGQFYFSPWICCVHFQTCMTTVAHLEKNPSLKVTLFFSPNLQKVQNCKWQQKICEATDTSQWLEVTLNFVEICLGTVLQGKNCKWRICMVEQQQLSTWMTILLKSLAKDCVLVLPCVLLLYSSFSRFTLGTCIQAPRPTKNRWESKFPARYAFS